MAQKDLRKYLLDVLQAIEGISKALKVRHLLAMGEAHRNLKPYTK